MPFLKAALIPHKKPEKVREKSKKTIRTLEDAMIAMTVRAWIALDDITTKREIALLGL